MKADTVKFFEFLEQKKTIFNIPVYQRNYEWSQEQCSQLFGDVQNIIVDDFNRKHFLGTIVYVDERGPKLSKNFIIIDGQQRITSFMLFLKAVADLSNDEELYNEILDDYLLNPRSDENDKLKLKSVEKDRLIFRQIIENKPVVVTSKIYENYQYFKECLQKSVYEPKQFFDALSVIEIVYIELNGNDDSENPQIIFESINSTGLSLTASDLIRNFLLMGISYDLQTRLYKDHWVSIENRIPTSQISTFIRYYLTIKYGNTVNEKKVYDEYKRFFINESYIPEKAIEELNRYSKFYHWIVNETLPHSKTNEIIKRINLMKATVAYPYIIEVLKLNEDGLYNWHETNEIVAVVESYLFRRLITDKKTNVLNKLFATLSNNISSKNEKDRLVKELMSKAGTQLFPRDDEFINSLRSIDLYNRRNHLAKLTLTMIENSLSKETVAFDAIQIEHIMPQTLTDEWKLALPQAISIQTRYGNSLGNLTLTGYNSELSNKLFEEKLNLYLNSNIMMTRELFDHYKEWNERSIVDRAERLSKIALDIWKIPEVNSEVDLGSISGEHFLDEDISVTGTKPTAIMIDGKEYETDNWKQVLMEFLNFVWEFDSLTFDKLQNKEALRRVFGSPDEQISPFILRNGRSIETNFSANSILYIVKIIANEYGISDIVSYNVKG
jgi:uncharacterized protein with ParB-like and HNH nuclease domain